MLEINIFVNDSNLENLIGNKVLSKEEVEELIRKGVNDLLIKKYGSKSKKLSMRSALKLIRDESQNNKHISECMQVIHDIASKVLKK